ncbi:MAG TPA: PEP-CTERM sorting domain-containing protein [Candidatus Omnitrophota bacterium]|nr:PEP-CTERM sorting domain-containing protein [Candidatus Omnitrophota bacterium]HQO57925.1 PEP-CTERM sorting domain-containing protein [Candidatus Omnitrophota bacterium]
MKKIVLIAAVMAAVSFISTPVFAFDYNLDGYRGPVEFKFSDFTIGSLRQSSSNGYGNADGVADNFSIFKVSTMKTPVAQTLWSDGDDGEELTGILYGVDDDQWVVGADGITYQSVGGIIDVYLDNTPDFDPTLGPNARGSDDSTYPTVTDGQLFLRLALVPGIKYGDGDTANDHITYQNHLDSTTSPFTGHGSFYLVVVEGYGTAEGLFDSNAWELVSDSGAVSYADFWAEFDSTTEGAAAIVPGTDNDWLSLSEDPIKGRAVPEPMSMLLLGSGLVGLVGLRRKQ